MMPRQTVFGFGTAVVDHLFMSTSIGLVYRGSRGGGSVDNILANAAASGAQAVATSVCGDDWRARLAVEDLRGLGVEVRTLLQPSASTRSIFQVPAKQRDAQLPGTASQSWLTSGRCPVCGSKSKSRREASLRALNPGAVEAVGRGSIAVVDKLSRTTARIAREARVQGAFTIADLGQIGSTRFLSPTETVGMLTEFDLVVAPESVVAFLSKRSRLGGPGDLAHTGPRIALVCTQGPGGMTVFGGREGQRALVSLPAPLVAQPIDAVGCGDAFVGRLVAHLLALGGEPRRADIEEGAAEVVDTLGDVLCGVGARGHLASPPHRPTPVSRFQGDPIEVLASKLAESGVCDWCGARVREPNRPSGKVTRSPGARSNLDHLARRVFSSIESPGAVAACRRLLQLPGTAFVVGTGGSFPVADFVATVLNSHGHVFAQAKRPLDYLRQDRKTDVVIAVSYSGKTPDIGATIRHAGRLGVPNTILLTGSTAPEIASGLLSPTNCEVISYGRRSNGNGARIERGFVSIAGTVAPCAVMAAAALGRRSLTPLVGYVDGQQKSASDHAARLVAATREHRVLPVFGGGAAWTAMLDVESKFTEASLGVVQLHESKDFSHGRFMSVLVDPPPAALFLSVGPPTNYEQELVAQLDRVTSVVTIETHSAGVLGSLEMLFVVQLIVQKIGEMLDRDISRPIEVPPGGVRLYRRHLDD